MTNTEITIAIQRQNNDPPEVAMRRGHAEIATLLQVHIEQAVSEKKLLRDITIANYYYC